MKKLLYTTAIAGLAMTYATVSSAETKVSGNLGLSYFMSSDDRPQATKKSLDGFGKESQINITNSGDLNNGMKYAAGFSLEMDGADAAADVQSTTLLGQQNENVFIDLIVGNTTISVGADHFQNTDAHLTNLVGFGYVGANGADGETSSIYPTNGSNYGSYGIGLLQKTDIGSFGVNLTPNHNTGSTDALNVTNDIGNSLAKAQLDDGNTAVEVTFRGSLGVKGLDVLAGHKMEDKATAADTRDRDATRFAAKYSTGAVSFAVDHITDESGGLVKKTGKSVGIAYSISDKLSVGYTRSEADTTTASTVDEETDMIAIGYNLGSVSVQAQLKDVESLGGTSGRDAKLFGFYLGTKF